MEDRMINLSLTLSEVLMLQELTDTRYMEVGYKWELDIIKGLEKKAKDAYQKPQMSRAEYERKLQKEEELWKSAEDGERIMPFMLRAKKRELNFNYDVEEGQDVTGTDTEADC